MIERIARAKLNLALHVRARRSDGYHAIETLFAFVEHGDVLRVAPGAGRFAVTGAFAAGLDAEPDNLVLRAERAFRDRIAPLPPLDITLDKRLPVASGIGGGSADAAAMLAICADLAGIEGDDPRLFALADALGSDVPACLFGRNALGTGRGERLTEIAAASGTPVLLVNPGVPVATAEVFARWDGTDRGPIAPGDLIEAAAASRNDLEAPARAIAPAIGEVLVWLASQPGVRLARMSGSGATCFALFDDSAACSKAAGIVGATQPGWWCAETALT
ncbi:4-(cytidine 5'-diphospho)-2-C-methyl-D-erythritol kinase [Sphingomonas japonica]|uniref:4-diphosphocytidyl-2-C-methyl-D-erythritol kinase n=1 Tax=Sphingomonas japonica TaxID=511662 RepID=A0ABX0U8D2_9SPHN|nr:4-(cytidine 5'-diphospho)-2-C-methyl-D-erythritol kinase [Sphingomonas japonica]NIJ25067.1 4-diphosphocytidyl-2-C-methyl-D-erythritol kinase [Sphingomonas japonica]